MKKFVFKKKHIYFVVPIVLVLVCLCLIIVANIKARALDKYSEITFVSPTQAIVFWSSEDTTLGFVKYGKSRFGKKEIALQTSSEKGLIHVAFLDNIPIEGVYISRHNESDSFLIFPEVKHIKYDLNTIDE